MTLTTSLIEEDHKDGHRTLYVRPTKEANDWVGIVKDGPYVGQFFHISECTDTDIFHTVNVKPTNFTVICCLTNRGFTTGTEFKISFCENKKSSKYILCQHELVSIDFGTKTTKTYMRRVTLATGKTLTREATMQALTSWLDSINNTYAHLHGGHKLVWCENNVRPDRPSMRMFYYWDFNSNKRKSCSNATQAITIMSEMTGRNFYTDMSVSSFSQPSIVPSHIPTVYI